MKTPGIFFAVILALLMGCNAATKKKKEAEALADINIPKVVTADIEEGIKANIKQKVEEGGGYFIMTTEEKELRLELVRVHTEYLSNLGPRRCKRRCVRCGFFPGW